MNPFRGLVLVNEILPKSSLENRFPVLNSGKGLVQRLFVPSCDWPSILAGRWPRSSGLGAGNLISLCKYLELTGCPRGALEPCLNYLPKRWGGLVFKRRLSLRRKKLFKVIKLPKRWGV